MGTNTAVAQEEKAGVGQEEGNPSNPISANRADASHAHLSKSLVYDETHRSEEVQFEDCISDEKNLLLDDTNSGIRGFTTEGDMDSIAHQEYLGLLKDLKLSEELANAFNTWAKQFRLVGNDRREAEEQFKLRHFFGGLVVVCENTSDGLRVVAAGGGDEPELDEAFDRYIDSDNPQFCNYEAFNVPFEM